MLTLFINTASSVTAIALFDAREGGAKLLGKKSWKSHNDEAEKLMPAIANLAKDCGKKLTDIGKVLCVKGPGSFTGLRVGVTVANTIAYLNKCELYAVDTFEFLWAGATATGLPAVAGEKSALLIFAGSGGVYVSLKPGTKERLAKLEKLYSFLRARKIAKTFGDITPDQRVKLRSIPFAPATGKFATNAGIILQNHLKPVKIIEPLYIKNPGITKSKKQTCYI